MRAFLEYVITVAIVGVLVYLGQTHLDLSLNFGEVLASVALYKVIELKAR